MLTRYISYIIEFQGHLIFHKTVSKNSRHPFETRVRFNTRVSMGYRRGFTYNGFAKRCVDLLLINRIYKTASFSSPLPDSTQYFF